MKFLVLLLKFAMLVLLVFVRLGEIDLVSWFPERRWRPAFEYYLDVAASIGIFLLVLDFVQVTLVGIYRRRHKVKGEDNFIIGVGQIYTILIWLGCIVGFLALFRIEIKEVFTSLSIIFAGLVLLTKDYVSNMINGMLISFSRQLSIGDNVQIGQHRGKIMDITLQNIHLLNDDDDYIFIPNNLVFVSDVVNYTKREIKRTSIDFEIHLRHLQNVEELEANLVETLRPFHDIIKPDSYYLRVFEVKKESVLFKFQYILREPNKEMERRIRRKTIRHLVELISEREKFVDNIKKMPE